MIFGVLISYTRALSPRNKKKNVSRKNDHPFPEKPVFSEQCEGSEIVGSGRYEYQNPMKNENVAMHPGVSLIQSIKLLQTKYEVIRSRLAGARLIQQQKLVLESLTVEQEQLDTVLD